ncbi:MAG: hypothetical protein JWQ43_2074 [Glaciihabitans sp.]|nr:hypothetical protein [Glaciihabitans sp.]
MYAVSNVPFGAGDECPVVHSRSHLQNCLMTSPAPARIDPSPAAGLPVAVSAIGATPGVAAGATPGVTAGATAAPSATATPAVLPAILRHSVLEDVFGLLTGTFVASFGLFLLKTSAAVTGGTAGLALLLSYVAPLPFGVVFFAVNVPFFALALWKKGWNFTLRTVLAVALVSCFTALHPLAFGAVELNPVYAVIGGNIFAGVGLLILFRHKASLGGFNILALLLQERLGWRAGYVQMVLDVCVVSAAFAVVSPANVALSAAGAVILNLILALNHRPGRYTGA